MVNRITQLEAADPLGGTAMMTTLRFASGALLCVALVTTSAGQDHQQHATHQTGALAELYSDLGDHHHGITTSSPEAQKFFDQGLTLAYAFNHAEAEAAFKEAARLDPNCAMCYWGIAFVHGPNINAPMFPESVPIAWEAAQKAMALADKASPREQAYIRAIAARYAENPPEDRSALDKAFAEAMRDVAREYLDDLDAQTIFAESVMDLMPWNYWDENDQPNEGVDEAIAALEKVMERDPTHPGANHYYIHLMEKVYPERGVEAAERLGPLVPAAGHLVHMPGHIYIRVGRYHDAVRANEEAIEADDRYKLRHVHGIYPMMYMPHNHHFLWLSAALAGSSDRAIEAARNVQAQTDAESMRQPGFEMLQHFYITPIFALARFGRWDEILSEPEPDHDLLYPRAIWHYARGLALAATGQVNEARVELGHVKDIASNEELAEISATGVNTIGSLLEVAHHALEGQIAAAAGDIDGAEMHLRVAIALEDALIYEEPPPWYHPTRLMLAGILLDAGRAADAEVLYREDLETYPENGWSLHGLKRSLEMQNRTDEAAQLTDRLTMAWRHADVVLE